MKFLFASDSFKGTLSSSETSRLLTMAAGKVFPEAECVSVPMADGGEGTLDACLASVSGERIYLSVHDPLKHPVRACYAWLSSGKVFIESASACGLTLVPEPFRNPSLTSTFGLGEMILDALSRGCHDISIGLGGSATNDGGMGCMTAIGMRFYDKEGCLLEGVGADLDKVYRIDASALDPRLFDCRFSVMCDVTNPLCGPNGATYTYARQKGADSVMLDTLEKGMCCYRDCMTRQFGINPDSVPGSGAAGGLAAALHIFLHAELLSGIRTMLRLTDFESMLDGVDYVITGEGRADAQSSCGKVMDGVGNICREKNIPVIGLVGCIGEGAERLYDCGISRLVSVSEITSLSQSLLYPQQTYYTAAIHLFEQLKNGK